MVLSNCATICDQGLEWNFFNVPVVLSCSLHLTKREMHLPHWLFKNINTGKLFFSSPNDAVSVIAILMLSDLQTCGLHDEKSIAHTQTIN